MTIDSEAREPYIQRITNAISVGRKDVLVSRKDTARLRRFLTKQFAELTTETLARMEASIGEGHDPHVISLLNNNHTAPYPNDFVHSFFKALPRLNHDQLKVALRIARDYFGALHLYRAGDSSYLDFMVDNYAEYLKFPGVTDLPYLTEQEKKLFGLLDGKNEIVESIRQRKLSSEEITIELLNEMSAMHSALLEGAL